MADELPPEVAKFTLVGRIVERGRGVQKKRGVVKYHELTVGKMDSRTGTHEGLEMKDNVPVDIIYFVFWDGCDEPEKLSFEETQAIVTDDFTDGDWLGFGQQKLLQDGFGDAWEGLTPDNVTLFMRQAQQEALQQQKPKAAPAKRNAAAAAAAAPAKRKAPAKKDQPLRAPVNLATKLKAQKEQQDKERLERKRKAAAVGAASGETGSPAKRSALVGMLAPVPRAAAAVTQPAAAAARIVPSGGGAQDSLAGGSSGAEAQSDGGTYLAGPSGRAPAAAAGRKGKAAAAKQQAVSESRTTSKPGGRGKQTTATAAKAAPVSGYGRQPAAVVAAKVSAGKGKQAVKAAPSGKGKQALLSPSKSGRSGGSGRAAVPAVLLQHEQQAVAPADSDRLLLKAADSDEVTAETGAVEAVYWFDRVQSMDGAMYRVYCRSIILPEEQCYRGKSDRRLRTWKLKPQADVSYDVAAVLAERKEKGGLKYLVKWLDYEADIEQQNWLSEKGLAGALNKLEDWRRSGRDAWLEASTKLLNEAGIDA